MRQFVQICSYKLSENLPITNLHSVLAILCLCDLILFMPQREQRVILRWNNLSSLALQKAIDLKGPFPTLFDYFCLFNKQQAYSNTLTGFLYTDICCTNKFLGRGGGHVISVLAL